ncbi:hypothetical protein DCAR_0415396 [Daucus carota subsp. sativus]|uniref:F-box domain-containing protein n=1 Tax=Daucus carota subsp. sativus TaxID=79200 RepID=A0AAF0WW99_DAUCS|nr:hypothetical protein DCAR_0415396 [Daucus carota subsp. sativus]
MAESSVKKTSRIEEDRISKLPQNVRETILCFMPIEDAVRTSILSKKWRHCWTMMPHLIFDEEFVNRILRKLGRDGDDRLNAYGLVSRINKIILLHKGPILKFSFTIPYYNPHYNCDAQLLHDFIDQWIPLLSVRGTKEVILDDYLLRHVTAHHFSSLDLTHLRLISVWFPYKPTFGRFTHLKILELVHAHYTDDAYSFKKNIFDCPVLEKLSLILSRDFLKVIFRFSFRLPYLAKGGCPNRLSKSLPYLKTLSIADIHFTHLSEVSCLLCMIRSAPNLCKLYISDCDDENCDGENDLQNYRIEDSEDCTTTGHLQIVSFNYFRGLRAELELVKFVLAHSPLLKTMFIHRHRDVSIKSGVALKLTEEILQYPRASTIAQVKHLEHSIEIDAFDDELWCGYEI